MIRRFLSTVAMVLVVLVILAELGATPAVANPVESTVRIEFRVPGLVPLRKYTFIFRLYDTATRGSLVFEEVCLHTLPADRVIVHSLGSRNLVQPLRAEDFLQQLWVEVGVQGRPPFPRIKLVPVPFAIGSQNSDMLDDLHAADFALAGHTHSGGANLDADTLDGEHGAFYRDAANLTGTLSDARLSANVALLSASQTISGIMTFNPAVAGAPFAVHSSNTAVVANLNADQLDGRHGADYRNAGNLDAGVLSNDRFSAHDDLVAEGHLGNAAGDIALNNGALQATLYAARAKSADALSADALEALDVRFRAAPLVAGLGGYRVVGLYGTGWSGAADSSIGLTIGSDGFPVVAYVDRNLRTLNVFHCSNQACTGGITGLLGSTGAAGIKTAITIGADGLPLVALFDDNTMDLGVFHCGDLSCSDGNSYIALVTAGATGFDPSVTIGADGLPIVSFLDVTVWDLRVVHCGNALCSSGNSITTLDSAGNVGSASSIAIGADGLPIISYVDSSNHDLKVLHCGNVACTSGNTARTVDDGGTVGSFTSITVGADGLPVVAYYDQVNGDLKVAHCGDAACSAGNIATTVDSGGDVGMFASITVDASGLPVVSYFDNSNSDLKVLHCGDPACTSGNAALTLDSVGSVGWNTSITTAADGQPIVAFWDYGNGGVKVARRFIRPLGRR